VVSTGTGKGEEAEETTYVLEEVRTVEALGLLRNLGDLCPLSEQLAD
jgi:hypothetical protein